MLKKIIGTVLAVSVTAASLGVGSVSTSRANNGQPTEIVALRSKYEKHYANSDGTRTAYVSTVPLHYFDGEKWTDIDNSLELDENGFYINKSNSFDVRLGEYLDRDSDNSLISINNGDYSIDITPVMESSGSDTVDESAVIVETAKDDLPVESEELLSNLKSAVEYENAFSDLDLQVEVKPEEVTEKIVINENDEIPEVIQYFIQTDALVSEDQETGSILFTDNDNTPLFETTQAFMCDSSAEIEPAVLETTIEECEDGYIMSIYPDTDWLENNDVTYPAYLTWGSHDFKYVPSYYISQDTGKHSGVYALKLGGDIGHKNEIYIKYPTSFGFDDDIDITDSKLYAYFLPNNETGDNVPIYGKVMTTSQPNTWENTDTSYTFYTKNLMGHEYGYSLFEMPDAITYSWINHEKTNGVVGVNGGVKLMTSRSTNSRLYYVISDYDPTIAPFFRITYRSNTDYKLEYAPEKYNNYETSGITTFQNRMNCYAYALQVYYNGPLVSGESYDLKPGEFGISYSNQITNYYDLCGKYSHYSTPSVSFMNFLEDRMEEDGLALGFTFDRIITSSDFSLPTSFNENNERIIAMVVGAGYWTGALDYHYYLRNGNGTCPNGHGGTCSAWSHKLSNTTVSNESIEQGYYSYDHPKLCDANINSYARQGNYSLSPEIRYYIINQDCTIYNSYHGNGHYNSSTGTPYYSY